MRHVSANYAAFMSKIKVLFYFLELFLSEIKFYYPFCGIQIYFKPIQMLFRA